MSSGLELAVEIGFDMGQAIMGGPMHLRGFGISA